MTVASTLYVGGITGQIFWQGGLEDVGFWEHAYFGLPFSLTIMSIIASHELGHYLTARRYDVDSTPPIFLPFPLSLIGTLGAFILIQSPFRNRRCLIDIGLAGPFAGFIVCIPALFIGVATSRVGTPQPAGSSIIFGEPLLLQWTIAWIWPNIPDDQTLYVSPVGLAAWFGLLLTAINLLPIGQLDGGHATYAVFRERAHRISAFVFLGLIPLAYFTPTWLFFALLAFALGIRNPHPPTMDDESPMGRTRVVMAVLGLAVFVLCFTPEPIQNWRELLFGS